MKYDILIKNGLLVDGTGNPPRCGDIAIRGNRIADVVHLNGAKAYREIDARGALICPGFIDAHSHTDAMAEFNPYFESTIRQGITTEIVGNCGNSIAPFMHEGGSNGFCSFGDVQHADLTLGGYMALLEQKGMSANLAWLVGHNTIRMIAGVSGSQVSEEQYREMEAILRQALEDGALGMSSGLEFEPGRASGTEEMLRLCAVLKPYDAIYTSHIRNRDTNVLDAVKEYLGVIRAHRIRGEISHMNIRHHTHAPENAVQKCIELIRSAREEGLDVLTDMTPLTYGIGQMSGILPPWLTQHPKEELKALLTDPQVRARLRTDCDRYWRFINSGEWDRVFMQRNSAHPEINGMSFPAIAQLWKKDEWDCYFDILADNAPSIESVILVAKLFTEEHLRETISNPLYMLVVDGYSTSVSGETASQTAFPLHYIGMAWFLTHHVRELHTLRLEEAVRKMTSMPAGHFNLRDRGLLLPGYIADVCVFDFDELHTPFDLANPKQYTEGMRYVMVGGTMVLDEYEHLHTTPGRNLRRC